MRGRTCVSSTVLGDIGLALSSAPTNLGHAFLRSGDIPRAPASYEEAIAVQTAVLGHPSVARAQNGLAALFQQTGQLDKAAPLFEAVLRTREAALGPDHPDVAESLINLGEVYRSSKRADEAVSLLRRAVAIVEGALGDSSPRSIRARYALALALQANGADAEAKATLRDARARLSGSERTTTRSLRLRSTRRSAAPRPSSSSTANGRAAHPEGFGKSCNSCSSRTASSWPLRGAHFAPSSFCSFLSLANASMPS